MQMACCPHVSTLIGFVSSKMTDDWFETMDQGLYTGVIFLDLRKAFDVVNLDLLVTNYKCMVAPRQHYCGSRATCQTVDSVPTLQEPYLILKY